MGTAKKQKKQTAVSTKVRFSIGAKLIIIIITILLVSLGSITALVSYMVNGDLQIAAEENNFEVNRRSAMEAENTFENIRSNSLLLIQTVDALGRENSIAEQTIQFFFEQNPQLAALIFSAGGKEEILVNKRFLLSRDLDISLADSYFEEQKDTLGQSAAGETILLNATSRFSTALIAMFFPWKNRGAGVLFSPESLSDAFGFGINQSYLINNAGDVLVHTDMEQMLAALNVADSSFTRYVWENKNRSSQTLFTDENNVRYFQAFSKLENFNCTIITGIEYDKVFEGIAATTRRNIYLTVTVLSFSILLIWFFAKSISIPLKALAAAAQTIEGGNFEIELRPRGNDEIGVLNSSFRQMCSALGIFGRFTNRDIAVRAMRGEIKPGGTPKHATVFFSDIRGFTEKSENFTKVFGKEASDRIVFWLNNYLTSMVECVEKTGGAVDKFIGDAVMAHWGTAYTTGNPKQDAFECVKAALLMRMALVKMNKQRLQADPGNPPIQIGCGINTGIVTAGQIGSDLRMEYTVIGDPVNLASRTEALNKPLGTDILITENTWDFVKEFFITEEMPSVTVKGKEAPIRIFAVVNFAIDKRPQTLAEVRNILGIEPPDLAKADLSGDEQKYKIAGKS